MMPDQVRVFEQRLSYIYFQEHLKLEHLLLLNLSLQSHGHTHAQKVFYYVQNSKQRLIPQVHDSNQLQSS